MIWTQFTLYQILWMFFIYAFLGWCCEVGYAAVEDGKFVNRGFLNGAVCPIYGFGAILVILLLTPLSHRFFVLFIGSILITSTLEFFTGWILEKIFHAKWWDYSDKPYNIRGYICLEFSLLWGIAATMVMRILQPLIIKILDAVPYILGCVCLGVFLVVFLFDVTITVITLQKLWKNLRGLKALADEIRQISDRIGDTISDRVLDAEVTVRRYSEVVNMAKTHRAEEKSFYDLHRKEEKELFAKHRAQEQELLGRLLCAEKEMAEEKWSEYVADERLHLEGLRQQLRRRLEEKNLGQSRLLSAFSSLKSSRYQDVMDQLRETEKKKKV